MPKGNKTSKPFKLDYAPIAKEIQRLLKQLIRTLQLIKTGTMYKSINVVADKKGNFDIQAVYYFEYVDAKYHLVDTVFDMPELAEFIENEIAYQIDL